MGSFSSSVSASASSNWRINLPRFSTSSRVLPAIYRGSTPSSSTRWTMARLKVALLICVNALTSPTPSFVASISEA